MRLITAGAAGLLMGLGILLAGMGNPAKVLAFLDIFGAWDPSLALVMVGAIGVALWPMAWVKAHHRTWLGGAAQLPNRRDLDAPLVIGSLVFGIGWGLAGICPGPALALLVTGNPSIGVFFVGLLAGMLVFECLDRRGV